MAPDTTDDTNGSGQQQAEKPDERLIWNPSKRADGDYRQTGVVELDIDKVRKILERIEERAKDSETDSGIQQHDSFHVVAHLCEGWEKGIGAELDEDAPHLNAEAGENFLFSHWDAIPARISRRSEYVATTSPRTFRNGRISEELKERQKTTDLDRVHNSMEGLDEAADWIEKVDEDKAEEIRQLRKRIWDLAGDLDEE
jgi:hypothetical protein